jgi:hypothetical protein
MKSLADIEIGACDIDVETIYARLQLDGIIVVRGYLDSQDVSDLIKLLQLINVGAHDVPGLIKAHKHPLNDGKVLRLELKEVAGAASKLRDVFANDFFSKLVSRYYSDSKVAVCEQVFMTHEVESEEDILPWHTDRQESLKFYINLTDVDEGNGAFRYDVGSHREGHLLANYQILSGIAVGKIKNDVPDAFIRNPLVINAKAGDLVVFDAAGYHKAGTVQKGRQRMVARGHSHPLPILGYTSKPWSVHWWVASILNPFRWLGNRVGRTALKCLIKDIRNTR